MQHNAIDLRTVSIYERASEWKVEMFDGSGVPRLW